MHHLPALLQNRKNFLCLLLILCCMVVDFYPRFQNWNRYESWSLVASGGQVLAQKNSDKVNISEGLKAAPAFRDTLRWWTGPWVAGPALSFFRPLSSYFWWIQYKLWGPDCAVPILLVNSLLHVVFVFVLWLLLKQLLGAGPAILSCCFFVFGVAGSLFALAVPHAALVLWIDTPEMTCGTAILLTLYRYLHYLRANSTPALSATCALYLVAIFWKELAYIVPFFAVLLMWYEKQWSRWKSLLPIVAITLVCFAYRTWALQGRGFHLGSNNSWKERYFSETWGGAVPTMLVNYDALPLSVVCVAAILLLWKRSRKVALGFGVASLLLLARFVCGSLGLDDPWLIVLLLPFWKKVLLCAGFVFIGWRFFLKRERGQLLGWGWVQAAYVPMLTTPLTPHAFYFLSVGWAIWLAYATLDLLSLGCKWLASRPDKAFRKWLTLKPATGRL